MFLEQLFYGISPGDYNLFYKHKGYKHNEAQIHVNNKHTHYFFVSNTYIRRFGILELRNRVTKSSDETELRKITSHVELLTRKCL